MAKTALITGGTAGIGRELARCFARDRHDVVLVARSAERLDQVCGELRDEFKVQATPLPADLSNPAAPQQIFDKLQTDVIEVEYLVNNAGFGTNGPFADSDLPTELEMIQVNVSALVAMTHLFLRPMVGRKSGRIMNVASTAAFQPGPHMAIYCATNAFVLSFTEAIDVELRG
ncbi:MAG: SDR family NAD(P)-dependent oxidoreductase, partial [Candidatus Hydrogenedentales bacterium]